MQHSLSRERPRVRTILKMAPTGARPLEVVTYDDEVYWCKYLHNPHGNESLVNEVVASVIGDYLKAPTRPWTIVDVPNELVGKRIGENESRLSMPRGPMFGSLNLRDSLSTVDEASHVDKDDNENRYPWLFALWLLCNAQDIQILHDCTNDMQCWSIDHGFWFDSQEVPWGLNDVTQLSGRTQCPRLTTPIASNKWLECREDVKGLDWPAIRCCARASVPEEWGFSTDETDKLVNYAQSRVNYTINELQHYAQRARR